MSDPITFDTATPRFHLPLLFAGQAQKEFFVNEGRHLTDALLHCAIESQTAVPPSTPSDGQAWLVAAGASGVWTGQAGNLACRQSGQWLFIAPRDGMRIVNKTSGQDMRWLSGSWITPAVPAAPTDGATIDSQARAAITELVQKLRDAGIFAAI